MLLLILTVSHSIPLRLFFFSFCSPLKKKTNVPPPTFRHRATPLVQSINIHPYVTEQFDNTQSASQTKRFCYFVIYAQFIVPKLQSLLRHVILLHGMYRHYIAEISLNVTLNHNHHHLTRDVDFSYLQNLHTVSKSPHVNGVLNIYAELHERSE